MRAANFSSLPGQLPQGASTLIASGGVARSDNGFLGEFGDFRGGVAYRQGISESLTLGGEGFFVDLFAMFMPFIWDYMLPKKT